jgi:DNA-binding transcriptional LysR family regulator
VEFRQVRYFVTLAEELHFGRAAEREHIVQSALSQQIQRLERELGVRLLDRTTHTVSLTPAGAVFLVQARQILAQVDRAAACARGAAATAVTLRVGIIDASYDSMPQILHEVQARYPHLVIHQAETGVPEQYQRLVDGRLDVGIGRAALAPPGVASHLFRRDPLGVMVPAGHRFTALSSVPVAVLAEEPLLLASEAGLPGSPPPCTRAPWRASARRPISSRPAGACTACLLPASRRCQGRSGGRSRRRPRITRGRYCGGRPTTRTSCAPSSAVHGQCRRGWAGCLARVNEAGRLAVRR